MVFKNLRIVRKQTFRYLKKTASKFSDHYKARFYRQIAMGRIFEVFDHKEE